MNTSEKFKAKVMKTGAEDFADATVKSEEAKEATLSPLALRLADEINALPKFRTRSDVAVILDPYVRDK
jgi:hypothetical protein